MFALRRAWLPTVYTTRSFGRGAPRLRQRICIYAAQNAPRYQTRDQITTESVETGQLTSKGETAERVAYQIVNLYHLVEIADPDEVVAEHRSWMEGQDIRGRIYFSSQGVNAQFTGSVSETDAYLNWMRQQSPFQGLRWNCDPVEQHMFPKLRLKHKPNLVQLRGGLQALPITHPEQRAIPLTPEQWRTKLKEAAAPDSIQSSKACHITLAWTRKCVRVQAVVLDVRNGYEWDAGHFSGAERPKEDAFCETPTTDDLPVPLKSISKDTPVLMYCTGGIRCDIFSTVLRKKGFQNLYSLEGGVQQYFKEKGGELWNGSLFVFDGRMAIHPESVDGSAKELPSSIQCQVCNGIGKVPHVNCANVDCNRLFVACDACRTRLRGCCCASCLEAPRLLRPAQEGGGYYGKFGVYAMDRLKKSVGEATERQLRRRARRLERVKERRDAAKRARLDLKKRLRAAEKDRAEPESSVRDALSSWRVLS